MAGGRGCWRDLASVREQAAPPPSRTAPTHQDTRSIRACDFWQLSPGCPSLRRLATCLMPGTAAAKLAGLIRFRDTPVPSIASSSLSLISLFLSAYLGIEKRFSQAADRAATFGRKGHRSRSRPMTDDGRKTGRGPTKRRTMGGRQSAKERDCPLTPRQTPLNPRHPLWWGA